MNLSWLSLSQNKDLPKGDEIDDFLTALAIGQKIMNCKTDYTKCFKINFRDEM